MQLQGELQKAVASDGKPAQKQFHNFVDCLRKTYHAEGIRGLQRGLGVAAVYQVAMNGARLGTYEPLRQTFNSLMGLRPDETYASTALLAGATSGAIGATLGNPFYLVKARMQAYSPVFDIGKQKRHYKNGLDALRTIVHLDGFRGLARGVTSNILRTASGSTVQLPSYNWAKSYLATLNPHANPYNPLNVLAGDQHPFLTMLSCSAFAGGVVLAVMQPMDVVLTRVSNQPTHVDPKSGFRVGSLYSGPIDALVKIAKSEGFRGYYKGSAAHFFRIAPHTILTLSLNDVYLVRDPPDWTCACGAALRTQPMLTVFHRTSTSTQRRTCRRTVTTRRRARSGCSGRLWSALLRKLRWFVLCLHCPCASVCIAGMNCDHTPHDAAPWTRETSCGLRGGGRTPQAATDS